MLPIQISLCVSHKEDIKLKRKLDADRVEKPFTSDEDSENVSEDEREKIDRSDKQKDPPNTAEVDTVNIEHKPIGT